MQFLKRLIYWTGMVFILATTAFAAVLYLRTYPELEADAARAGVKAPEVEVYIENISVEPWMCAVLMATGICALGAYWVLALEARRLRRKLAAQSKEG